jgi:hypothetical protein
VHVVATRVHHGYFGTGGVERSGGARVVEAALLLDRQRVHVGPQHESGSIPGAHQANHAGAANAGRHFEGLPAQPIGDDPGGAVLRHRQLGVAVQIAVDVLQASGDSGKSMEHSVSVHPV